MAKKKYIIGNNKEKNKEQINIINEDNSYNPSAASDATQLPAHEPLYESLWGNDHTVLSVLDDEQLADRRLYVRTLYTQMIKCSTISNHLMEEPALLDKPIELMTTDISMGGIGIICSHEISIGTILMFKIILDHIAYEIKCQVVYCFQNEDKFRAGLKLIDRDKHFVKHLKIIVARLSLQRKYGT